MNLITKVMQIIPDLGLGGAEIMVENLTLELIKEGYELTIISLYDYNSAITARMKEKDIQVNYLHKRLGIDWKIIYRLYKLMKVKKPDVVHTHLYAAPYAMTAAVFARVPVKVHTIHSIATQELSKPKRIINKIFYKYYGVVPVSISPLVKETVMKEYGFVEKKIEMIYNGIDSEKSIRKMDYTFKNDEINIIHIGSFKEPKNHIGLIESFKIVCDKFPNTVLYLIGAGKLEEHIKNCVRELGLEKNVVFLGLQANVYPFLNSADIFVLPSLWEGMPISLIEAMATGLPIVVSHVGGIPDMIQDKISGLVVEVNKEDISEALIRLIESTELREKLGNEAMIDAKQFTSKKMAKEYAELYVSKRHSR